MIEAKLTPPVVYLDHCALVEFANKDSYRDKFIHTLKSKSGTLLLSQANFFEAAGFKDHDQALRFESLLNDLSPNVYVADFMRDPGFFFITGGPETEDSPEQHWLAMHMLSAAVANSGELTFSTMFTEIVAQHEMFAGLFKDLKEGLAATIAQFRVDPKSIALGNTFIPLGSRPIQHILMAALLRDTQINLAQKFTPNDSMDLVHAVSSAIYSDFVVLDKSWCNRLNRAEAFITKHGVNKTFPKRCSCNPQKIQDLFEDLKNFHQ